MQVREQYLAHRGAVDVAVDDTDSGLLRAGSKMYLEGFPAEIRPRTLAGTLICHAAGLTSDTAAAELICAHHTWLTRTDFTISCIHAGAGPDVRAGAERGLGAGAAEFLEKVTLNVGVMQGGVKVNMLPASCELEADARLPVGVDREDAHAHGRRAAEHGPRADGRRASRTCWP